MYEALCCQVVGLYIFNIRATLQELLLDFFHMLKAIFQMQLFLYPL